MQNIKFYIEGKRIKLDLLVLILLFFIPFFNFWQFHIYRSKLKICIIIFAIFVILKFLGQIKLLKIHRMEVVLISYLFISMILFNFPTSAEYFIIILFGLFIMSIKYSDKQLELIPNLFVIIGIFFAISLIWQKYSQDTFYLVLRYLVSDTSYQQAMDYVQAGDYTGFACESNLACFCIAPAACTVFSRFFFEETRRRNIVQNLCLFCLLYYAIFLSGRRAFILAFPAILICFTIYYLLKKKNILAKLVGILLIIILFMVLYFALFQKVINLLSGGTGKGIELSNREGYWQLAISMFMRNPLIGMGMRSYDFQYNLMSGRGLSFAGAHNCYLQMLAEIGLIGTVLFFGFVLFMFIKTIKFTAFCVKNECYKIGNLAMMTVFMQCIFIIVAMSESVFFAPYFIILYFIILSIAENVFYRNNLILIK